MSSESSSVNSGPFGDVGSQKEDWREFSSSIWVSTKSSAADSGSERLKYTLGPGPAASNIWRIWTSVLLANSVNGPKNLLAY